MGVREKYQRLIQYDTCLVVLLCKRLVGSQQLLLLVGSVELEHGDAVNEGHFNQFASEYLVFFSGYLLKLDYSSN